MKDQFGRNIDYLRLGVTDRCNLRCRYCMPEHGIDFSNRKDLLSYEEILRLSPIFSSLGIKKLRITGGEPFVRKDIGSLLEKLSRHFESLHITTNATLLHSHFDILKRIEISGLNISIDSLDPENFFRITRRDQFDLVIDNIHQCIERNIPAKLNVVVMKGINDHELTNFMYFGMKHKIEVRFIEAMPFNEYDGNRDVFLSHDEILAKMKSDFPSIEYIPALHPSSAQRYQIPKDNYSFAVIPAYSRSLCGQCNRLRLTPKGELLTCLYAQTGISLKQYLRDSTYSDEEIAGLITEAVFKKKKDGFEEEKEINSQAFKSMSSIGG